MYLGSRDRGGGFSPKGKVLEKAAVLCLSPRISPSFFLFDSRVLVRLRLIAVKNNPEFLVRAHVATRVARHACREFRDSQEKDGTPANCRNSDNFSHCLRSTCRNNTSLRCTRCNNEPVTMARNLHDHDLDYCYGLPYIVFDKPAMSGSLMVTAY